MSPIQGQFTGQGDAPQVSSAAQSGTGSLRVTFNEEMSPDAALLSASNYTIGGPSLVSVTGVTAENLVDPIYVDLALSAGPILGTDNYTVTADSTLEDLAGNPMDALYLSTQFSGWVTDADSTCFEDNLPLQTTLDALLVTPIVSYPYTEQLRKLMLAQCTNFGSPLAAARTLFWFAAETNLRVIFAALPSIDLDDLEDIQLCYRTPVLDFNETLQRHGTLIRNATDEARSIAGETVFVPIQNYLDSSSPVYRVSAIAAIVLLGVTA